MDSNPKLVKLSKFHELGHIEVFFIEFKLKLTMNQDTGVIDHILDIINRTETEIEPDRQMFHKFQ
jgi:hypothetical protein